MKTRKLFWETFYQALLPWGLFLEIGTGHSMSPLLLHGACVCVCESECRCQQTSKSSHTFWSFTVCLMWPTNSKLDCEHNIISSLDIWAQTLYQPFYSERCTGTNLHPARTVSSIESTYRRLCLDMAPATNAFLTKVAKHSPSNKDRLSDRPWPIMPGKAPGNTVRWLPTS